MEPYLTYVIGGLLVASWVGLETWLEYRNMDYFDPEKEEVILKGVTNSIVYGIFWPTTLILFVLGTLMANSKGK
jgi:hypothetical protein